MQVKANAWVKAVDEGKKVNVKIEAVYGGQGGRPDRFVINGGGRLPSTSRIRWEVFDGAGTGIVARDRATVG